MRVLLLLACLAASIGCQASALEKNEIYNGIQERCALRSSNVDPKDLMGYPFSRAKAAHETAKLLERFAEQAEESGEAQPTVWFECIYATII